MFDVITIGSAISDTYIRSRDFDIVGRRGFINKKGICLNYGSKIEIDDILNSTGGGGTNTAVSFARLGFKTAFLGKIGNDSYGRTITDELKKEGVDIRLIAVGEEKTGHSIILFGSPGECTIMVYRGANGSLMNKDIKWNLFKSKWIYVTHMRGKGAKLLPKILNTARKNKTKIAINPGMTQIENKIENLGKFDILNVNHEESEIITGERNKKKAIKKLQKLSEIAVITHGRKGSLAYDGNKLYKAEVYKTKVVDAVGAGDSFGSGFTAGIMMGKGIDYALKLGSMNAASVVSHVNTKDGLIKSRKVKPLKIEVKKF